eukprot:scaffold2533_cov137-Cylindrotheca_fusiformis.AAC.20
MEKTCDSLELTESTYTHGDERFALTLIQSNGSKNLENMSVNSVFGIANTSGDALINIRAEDSISYDRSSVMSLVEETRITEMLSQAEVVRS